MYVCVRHNGTFFRQTTIHTWIFIYFVVFIISSLLFRLLTFSHEEDSMGDGLMMPGGHKKTFEWRQTCVLPAPGSLSGGAHCSACNAAAGRGGGGVVEPAREQLGSVSPKWHGTLRAISGGLILFLFTCFAGFLHPTADAMSAEATSIYLVLSRVLELARCRAPGWGALCLWMESACIGGGIRSRCGVSPCSSGMTPLFSQAGPRPQVTSRPLFVRPASERREVADPLHVRLWCVSVHMGGARHDDQEARGSGEWRVLGCGPCPLGPSPEMCIWLPSPQ